MKMLNKVIACFAAIFLLSSFFMTYALAAEITDEEVSAVIAQLEAIDTLQQMQNKRSTFRVTTAKHIRYDYNTTDQETIDKHNAKRAGYDNYISTMFAARIAAQQAYDELTSEQKAQIDPKLVAKLDTKLDNVFYSGTFPVTPGDNEYTFEAVDGGTGYGYEVSNHMVQGIDPVIPQTFILVDTSDGKTSWTPNGLYEYGKSNYNVTYCCDLKHGVAYTSHYKRFNLEDSKYYNSSSAKHIRAIVQNAYPFVSVDEMKANLKADGMNAEFVDSLTRADMITSVQLAIWTYANTNDTWDNTGYFASFYVPSWNGQYYTLLHDYSNECWDWFQPSNRTFDYKAAYRVNNLTHYLCSLEGVAAAENEIVISEIDITRASLVSEADDTYEIGMYVHLNTGADANDHLVLTATSTAENGTVTDNVAYVLGDTATYELVINARIGDSITVTVDGTQDLGKSVYFYEAEGGRNSSQCLVGVGDGITRVRAKKSFVFNKDIEMGIRIHKTAVNTGLPLSDITFDVYNVVLGEGESVGETPTSDDISRYATDANKAASVTTDATGYAAIPLDKGLYLVVEQHNESKVKTPVDPFFVEIPMPVKSSISDEDTDTEVITEYLDVVSIYPKNEPAISPGTSPPAPPSFDEVTGSLSIVKHDAYDETQKLSNASFQVFRAAKIDDTDVQIISSKGVYYAVVPVTVNGENLILTTDANGTATSPEMVCDTYFLVETAAPEGYELLADAIPVTVQSSLRAVTEVVHIANTPGQALPETGGAGTMWMLIIGCIMTVVTTALLYAKNKLGSYK